MVVGGDQQQGGEGGGGGEGAATVDQVTAWSPLVVVNGMGRWTLMGRGGPAFEKATTTGNGFMGRNEDISDAKFTNVLRKKSPSCEEFPLRSETRPRSS